MKARRPGRAGTPVILPGALDAVRAMSQSPSAMPYTVTVDVPASQGTFDPATGRHTLSGGGTVYAGRARLYPVPLNEDRMAHADLSEQRSRWYLRLPLGAQVAQRNTVTVTGADPTLADPALVGRTFRVLDHTPRVFGSELRVTLTEEPVP